MISGKRETCYTEMMLKTNYKDLVDLITRGSISLHILPPNHRRWTKQGAPPQLCFGGNMENPFDVLCGANGKLPS